MKNQLPALAPGFSSQIGAGARRAPGLLADPDRGLSEWSVHAPPGAAHVRVHRGRARAVGGTSSTAAPGRMLLRVRKEAALLRQLAVTLERPVRRGRAAHAHALLLARTSAGSRQPPRGTTCAVRRTQLCTSNRRRWRRHIRYSHAWPMLHNASRRSIDHGAGGAGTAAVALPQARRHGGGRWVAHTAQ
ncbi:hypothetical protein B0H15DRAFT_860747 [Mycena belliarum]|uniref:Uncharacterized protein n=1 Tax=Mycena belliarum TaxID=1033014 RepID=A0AAD6XP77_9AGAR|nr:hypothetical protein B0H15DRAFT_860747 [Mycena belliae]